jgi:hypothetical protein
MKLKLDEKFSLKRETYCWRESDIIRYWDMLKDSVKLAHNWCYTEFFLYNCYLTTEGGYK